MIDFEAAKSIANDVNPRFDYCAEYNGAYVFSVKDSTEIGGMSSPLVISKEDGKKMSFVAGLGDGLIDEEVKASPIGDWK